MKKIAIKVFKQIIVNKDGSTTTGTTSNGIFDIFREQDATKATAFYTKRLQELTKDKRKKKKKIHLEIRKEKD